jgi:CHAT domain-containing protein
VLTKDGVTPVPLDSGFDYNGTVKRFREAVSKGRNLEVSRNALYEHLIAPVLPHLPAGVKNIIIVPDGELAYLPFDILRPDYESPDFGETYALSLSPSVSVSMLAAKEGDLRNMAILAFADAVYNMDGEGADRGQRAFDGEKWINLPGTAAEVGAVQRIADEQNRPIAVYLQEDVSEETIKYLSVRGELARYPIIHFACHGYFNEDEPGRSGIVMSEVSQEHEPGEENDGYLTIPEIMALNFSAGMVLLSACETGLGEMRRGQGMVGLARAFLVSGTGSVGVSLWKIDDAGTSLFMTALYQKVLAEGKTFREAYYEVKNAFRHGEFGEDYARPMYWAAFTMYE